MRRQLAANQQMNQLLIPASYPRSLSSNRDLFQRRRPHLASNRLDKGLVAISAILTILTISTTIRYLCEWLHPWLQLTTTWPTGLGCYHIIAMWTWVTSNWCVCLCLCFCVCCSSQESLIRVITSVTQCEVEYPPPRLQCVGGGSSSHIDRSQCRVVGVDECIHHAALCWIVGGEEEGEQSSPLPTH